MDLLAELLKLTPEDIDVDHDPFARMISHVVATQESGGSLSEAVLNQLKADAEFWANASEAYYLVRSPVKSQWKCALGLWIQAITGDQDAFFWILRLFKPVVGASWVQTRIRDACDRKDWHFVWEYGEAVAWRPPPHGHENFPFNLWLAVNWEWGSNPLCKMTDRQILFEATKADHRPPGNPGLQEQRNLNQRIHRLELSRG